MATKSQYSKDSARDAVEPLECVLYAACKIAGATSDLAVLVRQAKNGACIRATSSAIDETLSMLLACAEQIRINVQRYQHHDENRSWRVTVFHISRVERRRGRG